MNRRNIVIASIAVLTIVVLYTFTTSSDVTTSITVSPVKGEFIVDVATTGELRAKNSTEIKAPAELRQFRLYNLTIQKLIPEGTLVKKGDFVASIDQSEILTRMQDQELEVQSEQSEYTQLVLDSTLTLSQARDALVNLEYTLEEREITLEQSKYESPSVQRQAQIELDKAKRQLVQERKNYQTKVKQAEARISEREAELIKEERRLERIRELMGQFTIYAPENGMVIYRRTFDGGKIQEGSQISAWSPVVAELPDFSVMESVTYVNEVDIKKIKVGQTVKVGLDSDNNKNLTGVITDVANVGEQRPNSDSKVFQVIIQINEADSTLRPSMTTSNRIMVNEVDDAIFVPLESIHAVDSLNFVFKKDGFNTIMQEVEIGLINDNAAIINRGIDIADELFLSLPEDTSGISRVLLQEILTSNQ